MGRDGDCPIEAPPSRQKGYADHWSRPADRIAARGLQTRVHGRLIGEVSQPVGIGESGHTWGPMFQVAGYFDAVTQERLPRNGQSELALGQEAVGQPRLAPVYHEPRTFVIHDAG